MDDLSEDDLARDWSLTPDDLALVATCRGPDHRRRFALQLCMLRAHGRFLDDYRQAPIKIINHLSHQLALPPVLALDRSDRGQTERAQAQRIRRHLGLSRFDKATDSKLREALHAGALEGRGGDELLIQAETILRGWQVMLPAHCCPVNSGDLTRNARTSAGFDAKKDGVDFNLIKRRTQLFRRKSVGWGYRGPQDGDVRQHIWRRHCSHGIAETSVPIYGFRVALRMPNCNRN